MTTALGYGCVNLGSAASAESSSAQVRLVHQAIDAGITVFDTADAYGNGSSERLLGKALKGRREGITISTKGGYMFRPRSSIEQTARSVAARLIDRFGPRSTAEGPPQKAGGGASYTAYDFSPAYLRSAVEASLSRLGVDHIDVYQLHGPDQAHPDLLGELDDLRVAGKIGSFGIGAESIAAAKAWLPVDEVGHLFIPFGILDPHAAESLLPSARATGRQVWARGVLGGGILGAAQRDLVEIADHPKYATAAELITIATDADMKLDELAVRWVRRHAVDAVILGISSAAHLDRNLALFALPTLDDETAQRTDECLTRTLGSKPS